MNDKVTTYKIWAPDNALWTVWAKPVLFANPTFSDYLLHIPEINWLPEVPKANEINPNSENNANNDTMVIIDLPGKDGVEEGLALANIGYRPVPLYNGVNGPYESMMIVNVRDIVTALYQGADFISSLNLRPDAPPVFLLDSNRLKGRGKEKGKYDNRWCIFPQDMPSAPFLTKQGIKKIILRSYDNSIQNDLSHILCRYQEQGIRIFQFDGTDGYNGNAMLKETKVSRPSQFGGFIYRFKVIAGLTRNPTGGFGGQIPDQYDAGAGGVYYHRIG